MKKKKRWKAKEGWCIGLQQKRKMEWLACLESLNCKKKEKGKKKKEKRKGKVLPW